MEFESIEGLLDNEISDLYNEYQESDVLAETFLVCGCKATMGTHGTHIKDAPYYNGWCHEQVDSSLIFSEPACRAKCVSRYGISDIAHLFYFYVDAVPFCFHTSHCQFQDLMCSDKWFHQTVQFKNTRVGYIQAKCHNYFSTFWRNRYGMGYELNSTVGGCYMLQQR